MYFKLQLKHVFTWCVSLCLVRLLLSLHHQNHFYVVMYCWALHYLSLVHFFQCLYSWKAMGFALTVDISLNKHDSKAGAVSYSGAWALHCSCCLVCGQALRLGYGKLVIAWHFWSFSSLEACSLSAALLILVRDLQIFLNLHGRLSLFYNDIA